MTHHNLSSISISNEHKNKSFLINYKKKISHLTTNCSANVRNRIISTNLFSPVY